MNRDSRAAVVCSKIGFMLSVFLVFLNLYWHYCGRQITNKMKLLLNFCLCCVSIWSYYLKGGRHNEVSQHRNRNGIYAGRHGVPSGKKIAFPGSFAQAVGLCSFFAKNGDRGSVSVFLRPFRPKTNRTRRIPLRHSLTIQEEGV